MRHLMLLLAAVGVVGVLGCEPADSTQFGSTSFAATSSVLADLEGFGSSSGVPLAAQAEFIFDSPNQLTIHVTNTTPASSSTVADAPVITSFAFNLAGGPNRSCFTLVEGGSRFQLRKSGQTGIFCGNNRALGERFLYELTAKNPSPHKGIKRGETFTFRLSLNAGCAGGFELTEDAFLDAPGSPASGASRQVAAKFQVVGRCGNDSGCGAGDYDLPEPPPPPDPDPVCEYGWSEFIATAAEVNGLPSLYGTSDTRAGSLEINFNGGRGFDGIFTDAPFKAGIFTLRNGAGSVLEQWQLNRRWAPPLDANKCNPARAFYECWLFPADAVGGVLAAELPYRVADSNVAFDEVNPRIQITGETILDLNDPAQADNSNASFIVEWFAPNGIDNARLALRLHFDADHNGSLANDPFVPLFLMNWPGSGPDELLPFVTVIAASEHSFIIHVPVEDAMQYVWEKYDEMNWGVSEGCGGDYHHGGTIIGGGGGTLIGGGGY